METPTTSVEQRLLGIVRAFVAELEHSRAVKGITLNSRLEYDLGVGSLERAELLRRIEQDFAIQLAAQTIIEAETLADLKTAIEQATATGTIGQSHRMPILAEANINVDSLDSLVAVLRAYALEDPLRPHIYLQDEYGVEHIIRYGSLYEQAKKVAIGIQAHGLLPGDTVAIMLPSSEEFFYAFFGTLLAGCIPVPIYPPFRPKQIEEYVKRESAILENAQVRLLITFGKAQSFSKILRNFIPSLKAVTTVLELSLTNGELNPVDIDSDSLVLIQYTSGSTGLPKGVLLSHAKLLANIRAMGKAVQVTPQDVFVSWLPLYHDMGLIGAWLGSLYFGVPVTILSPLTFLTRPERWLWAIHYHRATISAGPNFAYELCLRKIDEPMLEGLDLSSLRLVFNGAEAVYPNTLRRFADKFAAYGLREESIYPVYGMAETSVGLLFPELGQKPRVDRIKRQVFEEDNLAEIASSEDEDYVEFVAVGKPIPDHYVRIVDPDGNILTERQVGVLQFKGPSTMLEYYRNPEKTNEVLHDGWCDTGDIAYMADEEVFIVGRVKDLIIKAGRNLHPEEIEALTASVVGIRKGCIIAFGTQDLEQGTEKFIIVAEAYENQLRRTKQLQSEIANKVIAAIGIAPDQVIIVPPKTIPKTSSGKLRRSSCKQDYLDNKLQKQGLPTWLQITKVFIQSFGKKCLRLGKKFLKLIYTIYVDLMILVITIPTWLLILLLPANIGLTIIRFWARNIFRLIACPVVVKGFENIKPDQNCIYVANHASYIDSVVLAGILPKGTIFVGKQEIEKMPMIHSAMQKLGFLYVDREDFSKSVEQTENIENKIRSGKSVMIFAEGSFTYATGVRPFKSGAFQAAVTTNTPVCPISLDGTRTILRSGSGLFTPGIIRITISEYIYPEGNDWREATKIRKEARNQVAKHCGEYARSTEEKE